MDTNFEQKVRERAYEIWLSAGQADGMAHEHWLLAEQVVSNETELPTGAKSASAKKPAFKKVAAKKPAAKAARTH